MLRTKNSKEEIELHIDNRLRSFIDNEVLRAIDVEPDVVWRGFSKLVKEYGPRNRELLHRRDEIQDQIDRAYQNRRGGAAGSSEEESFLRKIGYLVAEPDSFRVKVSEMDSEISTVAGPQLVVPASNARYVLNATNARWGSLYDALYGTNVISDRDGSGRTSSYNPCRGRKVIAKAREFLDLAVPLLSGSHADATAYRVECGKLLVQNGADETELLHPDAFVGLRGQLSKPEALLFRHNGLHVEVQIDRNHFIGGDDAAGVADVLVEAAISTIIDCEDSVAAVDAEDKIQVYRNWLGLMRGDLTAQFEKGGRPIERQLQPDRKYLSAGGELIVLPGRSLLLVRNVGLHMYTDTVRDGHDRPVPEGFLDALVTSAIAVYDLQRKGKFRNSRTGSIYIVKPKLHGPEEVAFTDAIFERVEQILGLAEATIKIGLMDEERRTSANLAACIAAASHRIFFINTGFLDRTGDEIHTAMEAGPVVRKNEMRNTPWLSAYEARNVRVGLACGLRGRAQIGKGMWPAPDQMSEMMEQKGAQLRAGANTAWVPSPTAATLHAIHYHEVNVADVQRSYDESFTGELATLLAAPLYQGADLSEAEIRDELENNTQGILGYVVRWIDQGIGCSKVPDISGVGLMEDRATLRISSQHIANWLRHGVISRDEVIETLKRMAIVVDVQNEGDPAYKRMGPDFNGFAFRASCDLIFKGHSQPNGYTESILHEWRRKAKAAVRTFHGPNLTDLGET